MLLLGGSVRAEGVGRGRRGDEGDEGEGIRGYT